MPVKLPLKVNQQVILRRGNDVIRTTVNRVRKLHLWADSRDPEYVLANGAIAKHSELTPGWEEVTTPGVAVELASSGGNRPTARPTTGGPVIITPRKPGVPKEIIWPKRITVISYSQ